MVPTTRKVHFSPSLSRCLALRCFLLVGVAAPALYSVLTTASAAAAPAAAAIVVYVCDTQYGAPYPTHAAVYISDSHVKTSSGFLCDRLPRVYKTATSTRSDLLCRVYVNGSAVWVSERVGCVGAWVRGRVSE